MAPVSPVSPASVAAGAIASGRPPPALKNSAAARHRSVGGGEGAAAADNALVANMAARLSQVEKLNQYQAAKLARQSQELDTLRTEIAQLKLKGAAGESVAELRAERDTFRRQCQEMTQFLADYGLTWVGEEPDDETAAAEESEGEAHVGDFRTQADDAGTSSGSRPSSVAEKLGRPPAPDGAALNIQAIESQVQSLNAMVEKESARIVRSSIGGAVRARIVTDDTQPLPLVFFQDGVKLGAHAFLTYELAAAQQLIRDILDGYFPYALKEDHPDGVAMKVVDRTSFVFDAWLKCNARDDPDLTDNGSRLAPAGVRALRRPREGEELLGRLPEKVVKDGRICEVRGVQEQQGIAMSGGGASLGERSAEEVSLLLAGRDPAAQEARLQVKMEDGERVVFHMEPSHSIGDLEDAIAQWRCGRGLADTADAQQQRLRLRTAFPPKVHTDRSQTLLEAHLAPSAALFVGFA